MMWLLMGRGSTLVVLGAIVVLCSAQRSTLSPTSESFEEWRESTVPTYVEFFMLNITNADEILAGHNVSIRIEQLGPYVYRESNVKINISWHDNGTVEFYNQRTWYFEPEMSNGSLTDEIVSVNPVIVTLSHQVRHLSFMPKIAIDICIRMYHKGIFLRASVGSWLFDGIEEPLLNLASQLHTLSLDIPYDKFGWFYQRNGSIEHDGPFLINTGAADISQLGNLEKWRFSDRTHYRDECGVVKGSTGELWAPESGQQPNVTIFVPGTCSYIVLPKDKEVQVEGVEVVQYAADGNIFDNGLNIPELACYCAPVRDRDCVPAGALNVSACRYGAPAFVSLPHFLHSDPYYPTKIEGLNPTEDMNFRLALEKFTGMPLSVTAQLQNNLLVRHIGGMTINNQLPDPDVLVPMFWFRERRSTPQKVQAG